MPTSIILKPEQAQSDSTSVTHTEGCHCDENSATMSDQPRIVDVPREIHSALNDGTDMAPTKKAKTRNSISSKSSSKKKSSKKKPKSSERSSDGLPKSLHEAFPAYFELEGFMDALEEPKAAFSVQMDGSVVRSGSSSTTSTIASRGDKTAGSKTDSKRLAHKTKDVEMGVVESTVVPPEEQSKDITVAMDTDEPSTTLKKSFWQSITMRQVLFMLLGLIMVTAAVVVPILLLQDDYTNDGVARLDKYQDSYVVGPLPVELCHDGYGKLGANYSCPDYTEPGMLCDVVAEAMINVTGAEIALINIGVCKESLKGPQMTVGDIRAALQIQPLVMVEISGKNLLRVLEQAMAATYGLGRYDNDRSAYPYAAGLRYDVEANLDDGSRIALAEVNVEHLGLWRPLNPRRLYKVVTTRELATGAHGYQELTQVNDYWTEPLPFMAGDALFDYATKHPYTWWDLDPSSYSTHSFVGPDVDPTIATVPESICLEWASDPETTTNMCSQSEVLRRRGGGSCGLIAWSLLDQYLFADIALIQASLCARDIPSGNFIERQVGSLLPQDQDLVMVRMNGTSILHLLNNALEYAVEGNSPSAYPYTAGLRYNVNTTATGAANRISSVETMSASKRWIPFVESDLFSVITTKDLAAGQETGYKDLGQVNARATGLGTRQALLDYVAEWKVLYVPPIDLYSIQGYIS